MSNKQMAAKAINANVMGNLYGLGVSTKMPLLADFGVENRASLISPARAAK